MSYYYRCACKTEPENAESEEGEHFQCPSCFAMWGKTKLKNPPPYSSDEITYYHTSEVVKELMEKWNK